MGTTKQCESSTWPSDSVFKQRRSQPVIVGKIRMELVLRGTSQIYIEISGPHGVSILTNCVGPRSHQYR